jgi:hypothetical protein
MRKLSIVAAAAAVAAGALVATSPARAEYAVIRWDGTGFCQVWDNSIPTRPFPSNYVTVGIALPTFADALDAKDSLLRTGTCNF